MRKRLVRMRLCIRSASSEAFSSTRRKVSVMMQKLAKHQCGETSSVLKDLSAGANRDVLDRIFLVPQHAVAALSTRECRSRTQNQ